MKKTLYEMGYNSCTALRKPNVSENNRKIRLNWACERCLWTINDWKKLCRVTSLDLLYFRMMEKFKFGGFLKKNTILIALFQL